MASTIQPGAVLWRCRRLRSKAEFDEVFKKPKVFRGSFFTFLVNENCLAHSRLGLAVPKRKIKRAVDRNLFKRMLRESFRLSCPECFSIDVVISLNANATNADKEKLNGDLNQLWQKLVPYYKDLQSP